MSTKKKKNREKRDIQIRNEFKKMTGEHHLATEYSYKTIGAKWCLDPETIYRIVTESGHYSK
jgi:hypothetical protein